MSRRKNFKGNRIVLDLPENIDLEAIAARLKAVNSKVSGVSRDINGKVYVNYDMESDFDTSDTSLISNEVARFRLDNIQEL